MPEQIHKSQYRGALTQCSKCGRVIGVDQVNTRGRCEICSPPRGEHAEDEGEKDAAEA